MTGILGAVMSGVIERWGSLFGRAGAAAAAGVLGLLVGGCATAVPSYDSREGSAAAARARPGLATGWGEDRASPVRFTGFDRGGRTEPWATGKVFYNDEAGAGAMARHQGFTWRSSGPATFAEGVITAGLKNPRGRWLRGFSSGSDRFFVGEAGDRYSVALHNRSQQRVEVVVSVDGLDVMNGKPASFANRGYVVDPGADLEIDGFRQSQDKVAAFRFSSVDRSYAQQKHGDAPNVGVIGFAVFTEHGRDPWKRSTDPTDREIERRSGAAAFPVSSFATPP